MDDYLAAQGLVASGLGVALLPRMVTSGYQRNDVTLKPVTSPKLMRPVVAAVAIGATDSPIVAAMLEELRSTNPDASASRSIDNPSSDIDTPPSAAA